MNVDDFVVKHIGLKQDDLIRLTDDELKELRKQLYLLHENGIKLNDELTLLLTEVNYRSHRKAMNYSDDEVIGFVVDSCFKESLRKRIVDKKVSQNEAVAILKDTLNNSGGTLCDSDGFSIGHKSYSAKGVEISVYNSEYEKLDFDISIERIINSTHEGYYRVINMTYSQLYKKGLSKLRKSFYADRTIVEKEVGKETDIQSIELLASENGQLALF